jgi:hypothetical protein
VVVERRWIWVELGTNSSHKTMLLAISEDSYSKLPSSECRLLSRVSTQC